VELVARSVVRGDPDRVTEAHLADDHPFVVLVHNGADAADQLVRARMVVHADPVDLLELRRLIGKQRVLADAVDDVDPEAVDAPVEPEPQRPRHRGPDLGVGPVEVRLLAQEEVEVPLTGGLVPRPGRPAERGTPVVRRRRPAAVAPDVPVPHPRVARPARLEEPGVQARGVVRDPVEEDTHPAPVRLLDEPVDVLERAEHGIHRAVVGDVVPVVRHRRGVDRGQPEGVDSEPLQVLEPRDDPAQVTDAVAGRIGEGAGVDLVEDRVAPPRNGRGAVAHVLGCEGGAGGSGVGGEWCSVLIS
jgi:hypothetical protein